MHFHLRFVDNINPDVDVTYRTRNLHSLYEKRFIYFISDVPHLSKTTWNCLYISGSGKYTLGTCGKVECFLWNHIVNLFYEDGKCGLVRDHESPS